MYAPPMKTMPVGELKTHFSDVIAAIKKGEEIVISYGRKKENIAVIIPYSRYKKRKGITLGLLEGMATCEFAKDFEMATEELVGP